MKETKQSLSELWSLLRNKEEQFGLNKLSLTERDILQAIIHIQGKDKQIRLETILKQCPHPRATFFRCLKKLRINNIGVGKENGHQELMWQLLCMSGSWGKIKFHPYIGFKKKAGTNNNNIIKFLEQLYPNMKQREVELLAEISTRKELKELAEEHGIENVKF